VFTRLGIDPPKGVLLHGPPGTGKTLIARAVANEVDATFITVDGPEIMSKYKGESEERLRDVFERASEEAPRSSSSTRSTRSRASATTAATWRTASSASCSLMDGLDARGDVIVIGATNRVDTLDPALRRAVGSTARSRSGFPVRPAVARSSTSTRVGCPSRTTWTWTASRPGPTGSSGPTSRGSRRRRR